MKQEIAKRSQKFLMRMQRIREHPACEAVGNFMDWIDDYNTIEHESTLEFESKLCDFWDEAHHVGYEEGHQEGQMVWGCLGKES